MSQLDPIGGRKRRREERIYRFKTFCERGNPAEFDDSFRHNVRALLEFGHFEGTLYNGLMSWSFQLEVNRHPPFHIVLYVVEEPIEASIEHHCMNCQYVGWGHHLICNKKYHFLLRSNIDTLKALVSSEAKFDNHIAISPMGKLNLVEPQSHILHGVFHSNGFGHLVYINGLEAGSPLAGWQIMEFWDRLCTGLRARNVSLHDISQKRGLDMRLLYGVAYGEPWFGRWGYKFGRGSYGVTQHMYQKAIETIQCMPLCIVAHCIGNFNHDVPVIFSRYQTLSENRLVSLGDLLHFILELKARLPEDNCSPAIFLEPTCRWSPKRIQMATRVIVEALKRAEYRWVSRQEVRDAARVYIGDTGLLDFVLKSLGNHVVGNYLVRRSLNPVTKVLEYCLEDVSNGIPDHGGVVIGNTNLKSCYRISKSQLTRDLFCLYTNILKEQKSTSNIGMLRAITAAARTILDTKYFVKEYIEEVPSKIELGLEGKLKFYCTIVLRNNEDGHEVMVEGMLPFECITLKNDDTINKLKQEVESNFRELYWGLRNIRVGYIMNFNAKDTDLVFRLVEVGRKFLFQASKSEGSVMSDELIYEGSVDDKVVNCACGTVKDDGERMVSCDICEVWQHTRCVRIPNNQEVPRIFLCNRCEHEIVILPAIA
ncbi:hypothetical protein K2173_021555 [Erythroxylum novogranatense]|uniref:Zinc finger PHD-type domain-containing protein n=1 Tax=Erythroxylum novogranatense TaxID=1862640 RepID=A0AAV8TN81_9ROSI|nr:hypothetical protein K2173_021555 [Erythroxylum novogranatense]